MTMKRWADDMDMRKKEGYRFRIDKGRLYTSLLIISAGIAFIVLIYFLYKKDEDSWVEIERARKRRTKDNRGYY